MTAFYRKCNTKLEWTKIELLLDMKHIPFRVAYCRFKNNNIVSEGNLSNIFHCRKLK